MVAYRLTDIQGLFVLKCDLRRPIRICPGYALSDKSSSFRFVIFFCRADTRGLSAVTTSTTDFLGASTLESYSALFELDAAPLATSKPLVVL